MASGAADRVLGVTELLEQILVELDGGLQLFVLQRVCKAFRDVIHGSHKLREHCALLHYPTAYVQDGYKVNPIFALREEVTRATRYSERDSVSKRLNGFLYPAKIRFADDKDNVIMLKFSEAWVQEAVRDPAKTYSFFSKLRNEPIMAQQSWRGIKLFAAPHSTMSTCVELHIPHPTDQRRSRHPLLEGITTLGELADFMAVEFEKLLGVFIRVGPWVKGKPEGIRWWSVSKEEKKMIRAGRRKELVIEDEDDGSADWEAWSVRYDRLVTGSKLP